jgi:hypothetical protein
VERQSLVPLVVNVCLIQAYCNVWLEETPVALIPML